VVRDDRLLHLFARFLSGSMNPIPGFRMFRIKICLTRFEHDSLCLFSNPLGLERLHFPILFIPVDD